LVTPAAEIGLPATVQSVLAARIDRLPEREKRVLQTASVIGKKFSEPQEREPEARAKAESIGADVEISSSEPETFEGAWPSTSPMRAR
jgi:hypothetical protein